MAAAMATQSVTSTSMQVQYASLGATTSSFTSGSSTVRFGPTRVKSTVGPTLQIRAAGNPDRIDKFVDGVKSDASKNASNFGNAVAEAAGQAQNTVEDVGRDMGGKAQEAVDAGSRKVDQAGDKAKDVGDEVKGSTQDTVDAATHTSNGQSITDKAENAAANVGDNLKQNFDYGTGAAQNAANEGSKDAKKAADRL